jgi:threonine/homoserine/homoserine lactone efflux protein
MGPEQVAAYILFVLVAAGTPGPSNVLLLATGASVGVVRGIPCLLGVSGGMGMMMFAVAYGLGSLIAEHEAVLNGLRFAGAAFLLWLAWKIATAGEMQHRDGASPVGFVGAALFQWVNPKSWLVSISATATFLTADGGGALVQAAILGALFFAAALPACFVWLAFGSAVQRLLHTPRARILFHRAMGLLLAASVIMILV